MKAKKSPTVICLARTSCAPIAMIATLITPRSSVEVAPIAEKPVMVWATLRKRRCAPLVNTRASRCSAW